jgi:hypothetical protein
LSWLVTPVLKSRGYWGCWPGWLIRGHAGVCATG